MKTAHRMRMAATLGVSALLSSSILAQWAPYPALPTPTTPDGKVDLNVSAPRTPDGRPEHLRAACEGSLRRLRLERIDLYQLHGPDPNVPLEESVGALEELRREGKIRHIGLSNVNTAELRDVRKIAPIAAVQNEYNVARRESDDVVDACEDAGIAFLAYFPIDAGALARASGALKSVAGEHGATPAQVALAWLLHRSPAVVPIPGTSSLRHLAENVAATKISLTKENLAVLG